MNLKTVQALLATINGDACTCYARSWQGQGHDSECPLTYIDEAWEELEREGLL